MEQISLFDLDEIEEVEVREYEYRYTLFMNNDEGKKVYYRRINRSSHYDGYEEWFEVDNPKCRGVKLPKLYKTMNTANQRLRNLMLRRKNEDTVVYVEVWRREKGDSEWTIITKSTI